MNTMMVRDIYLDGQLGKKFGRHHRYAVASPAEAVRALCAMIEGFQKFLMESGDKGMKFHVFIGEQNIDEKQLRFPAGKDYIRFTPVLRGAKSGALAAIAGVVLIVVGVFLMFTPFAAFAPYVIGAGVGLLAVGVAQMLAPSPQMNKDQDKAADRPSTSFNGPVNTQAQGAPVAYFAGGPAYIGSAVISASINVNDGIYVPAASGPQVGVGGGTSAWAALVRAAVEQLDDAQPE